MTVPSMCHRFLGTSDLRLALRRAFFCFAISAGAATPLLATDGAATDSEPQLMVGILVDTSLHQKKVIEFEREAVDSIREHLNGVAADAFVVTYSSEVEQLHDWSSLAVGLKTAFPMIQLEEATKPSATLLFNALSAGLLKLGEQAESASRVLIVIGEGNDAGSSVKYAQIKKLARSNHVQCFALLIADHNLIGGRVRHFGWDLYDLASATKGAGYDIEHNRKRLEKAIEDILRKIRQNQARQDTAGMNAPLSAHEVPPCWNEQVRTGGEVRSIDITSSSLQ